MKPLFKIVAFVAFSLFTATAFAQASGEAEVRAAAEGTIAKIEEAVKLVEQGADKAAVIQAINQARQLQKEFRYEITERQRQKAGNKLRDSRDAFAQEDTVNAKAHLNEALAMYKEMLDTYLTNH